VELSRGNLISLIGAIGGIITIFLPWVVVLPLWGKAKETFSLYELLTLLLGADEPFSFLGYYWFILLCLLLVCGYYSINGKGKLAHIGVGLLQVGVLTILYTWFNVIEDAVEIRYGFYIAFICALLLIIGGIYESHE